MSFLLELIWSYFILLTLAFLSLEWQEDFCDIWLALLVEI